jgi:predicted neuraminidase
MKALVVLIAVSALPFFAAPGVPSGREDRGAIVLSEFIFASGPTPQCHASTLAESGGILLAAWFGGISEGQDDVGIWLARREGGRWSAPVEVADGLSPSSFPTKRFPCWNPVLFQPRTGPLLLFYKVGPSPAAWWGVKKTSADGGRTWTPGVRLPAGFLGPVKNKPLELAGGTILCPSSTEDDGWRVRFERTNDLGETWKKTPPLNDGRKIGAIQPAVLIHPGGRLQALGRTRQGRVFEMWSDDGGWTWGEMGLTSLPNPNSGLDALTLADGRHLLVYNPAASGRTPLSVALSSDGKAWHDVLKLEGGEGEFSYPAVIQTGDGRVHVSYTWKRIRVRHVVIEPKALD